MRGGAIIGKEGRETRHHDQATRTNADLKALGPALIQLTSAGVYRLGLDDDAASVLANTPIARIEYVNQDLLVGPPPMRTDGARRC